jgi:hypothetical protein
LTYGVAKAPQTMAPIVTNGVAKPPPTMASWPEKKHRNPSVVRTVRLTNIPGTNKIISNITRLVFFGAIMSIRYEPGSSWAEVTFVKAEECQKYLDATKNGLSWPEEKDRVIIIAPCDPESGLMEHVEIIVQKGITRCVRVVDIDSEWKPLALKNMAEQSGRKIDRVINGHDTKSRRIVDFRFCKTADAVTFKAELQKDEDFVNCHISYSADPCSMATDVHNGVM